MVNEKEGRDRGVNILTRFLGFLIGRVVMQRRGYNLN